VTFCGDNETPWQKFVRCMMHGHIGRHIGQTPDGVAWDDSKICDVEMNSLMADLG